MKVRYDKLWRLMKDNKMKKSELAKAAEISSYAMTKLNRDLPVSMEVMMNLCKVLPADRPFPHSISFCTSQPVCHLPLVKVRSLWLPAHP